jgi:hypothetical protein
MGREEESELDTRGERPVLKMQNIDDVLITPYTGEPRPRVAEAHPGPSPSHRGGYTTLLLLQRYI